MTLVQVARSLAGLGVDETSVAAALLHDVLDDLLLPEAQLERMLGNEEAFVLVKQVRYRLAAGGGSGAEGLLLCKCVGLYQVSGQLHSACLVAAYWAHTGLILGPGLEPDVLFRAFLCCPGNAY